MIMNSYGYSQERSIHRLDQLLNRNEQIYQNLKVKLDQINKSSSNIHRNISYIHSFTQQTSEVLTRHPSAANSSTVQQEGFLSDVLCITTPEELVQQELSLSHNFDEPTVDFGRNKQIEEVMQGKKSEDKEQSRWIKQQSTDMGNIVRQKFKRKDRTSHLEIQNITSSRRVSPRINNSISSNSPRVTFTYEQQRASLEQSNTQKIKLNQTLDYNNSLPSWNKTNQIQSQESLHRSKQQINYNKIVRKKQNQQQEIPQHVSNVNKTPKKGESHNTARNLKGNSIYLNQVAKIQPCEREQLEDMPTFRQMFQQSFEKSQYVPLKNIIPKIQTNQNSTVKIKIENHGVQTDRQTNRSHQSFAPEKNLVQITNTADNQSQKSYNFIQQSNQYPEKRQQSVKEPPVSEIDYFATSIPRIQLNQNEQKIPQWQSPCESYLFAPFNKVYRSPIVQLKSGCQILLERRSKTSFHSINKSCDPIKFKFKNIQTDQQSMIKNLLQGSKSFNLDQIQSNKVLIIGGKDTLKKKIHLGLLAYLLQAASLQIKNSERIFFIKVQHKQSGNNSMVDAHIQVKLGSQRVAQLQLQRAGEDVSRSIIGNSKCERVLRVTKVSVEGEKKWNFSIISSNRIDSQFAKCIGAGRICWSINPLVKNYNEVHLTLETMQKFIRSIREQ